jgi:hypothetical protein
VSVLRWEDAPPLCGERASERGDESHGERYFPLVVLLRCVIMSIAVIWRYPPHITGM